MNYLAMALDPAQILTARGLPADPWQRDVLLSSDRQILLNCCRQAGKSTITSALALHTALFTPNQLVLLLSPGQRQSGEIFRKMLDFYNAIERPVKATYETQLKIELANGSRILCLPGKEQTIRGYSPNLLVIDEASRVPDDLYRSVRPMLAVSKGRLIALSTPFGQRGWFYDEWNSAEGDKPCSLNHAGQLALAGSTVLRWPCRIRGNLLSMSARKTVIPPKIRGIWP